MITTTPILIEGLKIYPHSMIERGKIFKKEGEVIPAQEVQILGQNISFPKTTKGEEFLMNTYDVGRLILTTKPTTLASNPFADVFLFLGVTDDAIDACIDHALSEINKQIDSYG